MAEDQCQDERDKCVKFEIRLDSHALLLNCCLMTSELVRHSPNPHFVGFDHQSHNPTPALNGVGSSSSPRGRWTASPGPQVSSFGVGGSGFVLVARAQGQSPCPGRYVILTYFSSDVFFFFYRRLFAALFTSPRYLPSSPECHWSIRPSSSRTFHSALSFSFASSTSST